MDMFSKLWMSTIRYEDPKLNRLTVMEEYDLIKWLGDAEEQEYDKERKTTRMQLINRVGKRVPIGSFGGLSQAHRKLVKPARFFMGVFQLLRVLLNLGTVLMAFISVFDKERVMVDEPGAGVYTTLTDAGLNVCIKSNHTECTFHPMHRLNAYRVCSAIEVAVVIFLILCYLPLLLSYLCCCETLPGERPWFFVFAPRLAAGFSSLAFLNFISFKTFRSLTLYNEGQMWFEVIICSVLPNRKYTKETGYGWRAHPCAWVAFLIITIALFAFSFQALLVKISEIHWAATMDFRDWTFGLWFSMIGFINQVSFVFDLWSNDISSLLRLVYGGVEHAFTPMSSQTIAAYLSMICDDLSIQSAERGSWRFTCAMVMSYLQEDDFQQLLVSQRKNARYTSDAEQKRLEVLQQTFTSYDAMEFKEQLHGARVSLDRGSLPLNEAKILVQGLKQMRIASLKIKRDALMRDAQSEEVQPKIKKSQFLHLAAEVQDLIEDVEDVEFLETLASATQDEEHEEDVESDSDDEACVLPMLCK